MSLTALLTIKACILALIIGALSGCSFKLEAGYHGKTGRDDNTVTESFIEPRKRKAERY